MSSFVNDNIQQNLLEVDALPCCSALVPCYGLHGLNYPNTATSDLIKLFVKNNFHQFHHNILAFNVGLPTSIHVTLTNFVNDYYQSQTYY